MANPRWTRDTAIEYLANNPSFQPTKPIAEYSTPILKRKATSYQDAERQGRRTPTVAETLGHGRARVEHLAADKENHIHDQFRIAKPDDRQIDQADLKNLYKRAKKGKKKGDKVMIAITGIGVSSPRFHEKGTRGDVHTYTYWSDLTSLKLTIEDFPDIFDFAFEVTQLAWDEVLGVSFAFVESKK